MIRRTYRLVLTSCAAVLVASAANGATLLSHFTFDSDFTNAANPALNSPAQFGGVTIANNIVPDAAVGAGSLKVDGVNDAVSAGVAGIPGATGAFYSGAVAFWVKSNPGATPGNKNFMGVTNGDFATTGANDRMALNVQSNGAGSLQIFIRSQNGTETNNTLQFRHQVGSTFPTDWNNGQWHHVTFSWSVDATGAGVRRIFLDGQPVPTGVVLSTLENDPVKTVLTPWEAPGFLIGGVNNRIATGGSLSNPFGGWLDDIRIYDGPLDAAQVADISGVPEPATAALVVAALGFVARRRRN
jgi:hypothetical protein